MIGSSTAARGLVAVAALFAWVSPAFGFHEGGVAPCDGCHVMHNASGGASTHTRENPHDGQTNMYLLQGTDQSSTCLICHAAPRAAPGGDDYHNIANLGPTGPAGDASWVNLTPGGDFGWLRVTFTWQAWEGAPAGSAVSPGERHGHSVVAADFGLAPDSRLTVAPGGTFASGAGKAALGCISCHDPHGRYRMQGSSATSWVIVGPSRIGAQRDPIAGPGSYGDPPAPGEARGVYRHLGGRGYAPMSNPSFPFQNDSPIAVAPEDYNKLESASVETRVAYGTGMSEWCQNCHTSIHLDAYITGAPGLRHPAGADAHFRDAQAQVYRSYLGSGDLSGTLGYTSLVPFETGTTDLAALRDAAASQPGAPAPALLQATTSSSVMCLSCHRAHASAFDSATRWNMRNAFVTEAALPSGSGPAGGGRSPAQAQAAYYGRTVGAGFQPFQRSLCNRCHAKD